MTDTSHTFSLLHTIISANSTQECFSTSGRSLSRSASSSQHLYILPHMEKYYFKTMDLVYFSRQPVQLWVQWKRNGMDDRSSILDRVRDNFPQLADRLWGPASLLSIGYRRMLPTGRKRPEEWSWSLTFI